MKKTRLVSLLVGLAVFQASTLAVPFVLTATSNIFAAGAVAGTSGTYDNSGTAPPSFAFAAGGGSLTFSGVTGNISCGQFCLSEASGPTSNGPDGAAYNRMETGATNIASMGTGILGITFNDREMFMVGVFLDNKVPSGAGPPNWVYDTNFADNSTQISPGIGQVFYIGNGLTGGPNNPLGLTQTFFIPSTATRLFLGFADATGF